jgi:hypothetical protein
MLSMNVGGFLNTYSIFGPIAGPCGSMIVSFRFNEDVFFGTIALKVCPTLKRDEAVAFRDGAVGQGG